LAFLLQGCAAKPGAAASGEPVAVEIPPVTDAAAEWTGDDDDDHDDDHDDEYPNVPIPKPTVTSQPALSARNQRCCMALEQESHSAPPQIKAVYGPLLQICSLPANNLRLVDLLRILKPIGQTIPLPVACR